MPESVKAQPVADGVPEQGHAPAGTRQDLLGVLRHDLRTPINHIIGYSELLAEGAEELGQRDLIPSIQKIQAAGQALLAHVDEFLDPTRVAIGAIDLDPMNYELRTQLNAIIGYSDMLQEEAEDQGHEGLAADFRRVHTAGRNLLGVVNALLELSKAEAGEADGGGPRVDRATASHEAVLPQPSPDAAVVQAPVELCSVLVVDDNEINRDMLARRLDRLGYRVALAEHGRAALERLQAEPFDLVLLDILMPEMNGYQVLQHLQSDERLRHIPVIVLSAMDDLESVVQAIQLGAEDYLILPINPILLRARIGACLERKRLRDQELLRLRQVEQALAAQRVANAQLERMNKVKSDFVSFVAHEFRTPLTGIQGFSEMMVEEDFSPEEMKEFAGDIHKDAKRLARLITEMLDLDRMESGRMTLNLEQVDLNAIIEGVARVARPNAPNHSLAIRLDPALPKLVGDLDKLTEVVTNLVSNAVKYSPQGGEILVASQVEGDLAHVRVRDQGIGMPPEALEIIFDRYSRISSGATRDIIGTGLGLPIVRQIVQMHGGKAWAESTLGEGSIFHFTVPLRGPGA